VRNRHLLFWLVVAQRSPATPHFYGLAGMFVGLGNA
jgi:hypothetical protein